MAFWTNPKLQPLKKFQFRITIGEVMWYAKSITLPSFEVPNESYQLINQKFKYPGVVNWNDISVTLVETGKSSLLLRRFLTQAGYSCPGSCLNLSGLSKDKFNNSRPIVIEQLKPDGKAFQYWEITNWMISNVNFGDMSYESDEILTVEMSIAYDCAYIKLGSILQDSKDAKPEAKKAEKKKKDAKAINEAKQERQPSSRAAPIPAASPDPTPPPVVTEQTDERSAYQRVLDGELGNKVFQSDTLVPDSEARKLSSIFGDPLLRE